VHVAEFFDEGLLGVKLGGLQEAKERVEFVDVVLQRRAGQQQPALAFEKIETLEQLALVVLQSVSLVDDASSPTNFRQFKNVLAPMSLNLFFSVTDEEAK